MERAQRGRQGTRPVCSEVVSTAGALRRYRGTDRRKDAEKHKYIKKYDPPLLAFEGEIAEGKEENQKYRRRLHENPAEETEKREETRLEDENEN